MNEFRHPYSLSRLFKVLGLTILVFTLAACTTQKKRGELSKFQKFYHNTTAKYNGYFNANVLYTESIAKLNQQHRDNYNKILEVYPYVASPNAQSEAGNLDEAIKKLSVVVNLHRESHWTDDCYLLLGKIQYAKQNYEDAQDAFEFLAAEYSPEAMAARERDQKKGKKRRTTSSSAKKKKKPAAKKSAPKRKSSGSQYSGKKKKKPAAKSSPKKKSSRGGYYGSKKKKKKPAPKKSTETKPTEKTDTAPAKSQPATPEKTSPAVAKEKDKSAEEADEKAEKYFLKHRPAFQEGQLWLARTYIERDMFAEAEIILNGLERDSKTFKDLKRTWPRHKPISACKRRNSTRRSNRSKERWICLRIAAKRPACLISLPRSTSRKDEERKHWPILKGL